MRGQSLIWSPESGLVGASEKVVSTAQEQVTRSCLVLKML